MPVEDITAAALVGIGPPALMLVVEAAHRMFDSTGQLLVTIQMPVAFWLRVEEVVEQATVLLSEEPVDIRMAPVVPHTVDLQQVVERSLLEVHHLEVFSRRQRMVHLELVAQDMVALITGPIQSGMVAVEVGITEVLPTHTTVVEVEGVVITTPLTSPHSLIRMVQDLQSELMEQHQYRFLVE